MRTFLLFCFLLIAGFTAQSQTRQTIANGLATNPLIWNCTCIPQPGDVIVIAHNLTLNTDFGYTSGSLTVNSGASITGDLPTRNLAVAGGAFTNNGTVTIGNLYHGGGTFTNSGAINVGNAFASDLLAVTSNSGTFSIADSLYINTNATLNNSGNLSAPSTAAAGTFTNTGSFSGTDVWNLGTLNHNAGSFAIANLYTNGSVVTNAPMTISGDFWNAENVDINHNLTIGNSLIIGDTLGGPAVFNNDGVISIGADLTNSKSITGTGRFCVAQITTNSGTISGVDICDLTGGAIDFNSGTIAMNVTFCATPCGIGVEEGAFYEETIVSVVPNPFNDQFEIRANAKAHYSLTLVNNIGQTILSTSFLGDRLMLDGSGLASGVYFYRLTSEKGNTASGQLMRQ
ncbi:MAG TPA: T9SS type A sorting domain-containing protein [Flavobacteriales bacterium]|nr:T9SS type A sorting domain-containing protein [Flavobacteriales bacterium]